MVMSAAELGHDTASPPDVRRGGRGFAAGCEAGLCPAVK